MRFIIVTGMSGAGKTTVLKTLEDAGFFCVDNLPVMLLNRFSEMTRDSNFANDRVAVGIDIRSGERLSELGRILSDMKDDKFEYEILFLDASDKVLVKRYKETRREHPLQHGSMIEDGIREERRRIEFLRQTADHTIDTTSLRAKDLKAEIDKLVRDGADYKNMIITVMSFGYKFGIPAEADFVFDVRFLPNPYYDVNLRPMTGNDKEIQDYVMSDADSERYLTGVTELLKFSADKFTANEDRHSLVVAFGCTGGRHRSVTMANLVAERLKSSPYSVRVYHRDMGIDAYVKGEV